MMDKPNAYWRWKIVLSLTRLWITSAVPMEIAVSRSRFQHLGRCIRSTGVWVGDVETAGAGNGQRQCT
ncbi:hypothetical protein [Mycobacterium uberis]|uniref:hypothetical protein n=1 Tax=Mycobacterium uberis TaxID=2162698 RepID=UPI001FB31ABB|nr:hypothetical protein [Mycobacterium uberis]